MFLVLILALDKLYEKSGHLKFYQNEMYKVLDPQGEEILFKTYELPSSSYDLSRIS
jgi:threonyl-tRNA synthetase